MIFQELKSIILKQESKMQNELLESMLQMSTIQFKEPLNVAYQVVEKSCTFLLGDRKSRWWGTRSPTIFTSAISLKIVDIFENLTKPVEIELSSMSCLNNLE